ncbi:MAG TPA: chloride channel protein [Paludibacteraceae bacterium]|nr:chloride channel protein [Paludibacteraceae bacterium]OPZ03371.1 MAG: H(+)/Cl(-) exchange transporter ClcA [Bacteroidetes bacterium ADurb.BinA395]HOF97812.1 chloride channel protein [Paludibacteraceae bacterium]HOJ66321.1 chloride channel protein [Paludibacteraceae bacterium]HOR38332.1 chloride channel protein [Paludibacteraceae bacterium]
MDWKEIYLQAINWREKHIKERQFILILSFLTGIFAALAAFVLKMAIHSVQSLVTESFNRESLNYLYLITPAVGIIITSLFVRHIVKDDISHGVTRILYAISQRKSILKLHNVWTSLVGSSITIGFGGSVGAEAPIVLTGSAIGSNLGKFFKMNQKTMMLLIGCGAAGAIAGIFKAPIAGLVFTLEVLMLDMTMTSIVPLLISSVTATSVTYILTGDEFMFQFTNYEPFAVERIPYLLMLGVVCGLVSLYFTRGMNWLENFYKKFENPYIKWAIGGSILSVLIFLFPPLYGEGYDTIASLLNNDISSVVKQSFFLGSENKPLVLLTYLVLIIVFKIFATASTTSAGGVGGIFAPSLFVGCITGFVVAEILNLIGLNMPIENFALAGMAGLMSGVMHAPLTGIFLIAELTGSYYLFMTLIIVSTISYLTIILFEPHSLYAMRLAQKGELITHNKDKAVLTLLKMENVIETNLNVLEPDMKLGEVIKIISHSKRNVFPVVNPKNGVLLGILTLDEIRNIMFRPELYQRFTVRQLMISPPTFLNVNMPMEKVMQIFEDTGAWNLPVVDDEKHYIGFVSKSTIFNSYRHVLVHFSDE